MTLPLSSPGHHTPAPSPQGGTRSELLGRGIGRGAERELSVNGMQVESI